MTKSQQTNEDLPFPVEEPKEESRDFVPCTQCRAGRDGRSIHPASFHRGTQKPPLKSEVVWIPPKHLLDKDGNPF